MKKILSTVLPILILLSACSPAPTTLNENKESKVLESIVQESKENNSVESEKIKEPESVEESISVENLDYEVEIIISAIITDSEQTIESYVDNLNLENPDKKYKVYDESHYSYNITEKDRLDMVNEFKTEKGILHVSQSYTDFLSQNEISDYVSNFELSEDYTEVKIYVQNLDKLGWNSFSLYFGSQLYWSLILDSVQAHFLISPEERIHNIIFIDNDTKEEIKPFEN